jgi:hypothetical protein
MILSIALLALAALPQTPDPTLPPANAHVRFTVAGHGVQNYNCSAVNGGFQWVFEEPVAGLFDPATRQQVGTHSAGPTWTWSDGSAIVGKVLQTTPSIDPGSIPWLLLETHSTGTVTGALTGVTFVRRSDTQAGKAPAAGCDANNVNVVLHVPYQATYTFYSTN